ncbi:hypothetical protein [Nocardioides sp.]|uniref:hypothetical protein n=1 Tax=Nocardioides sp. TaxID=35761 RepID=UPI00286A2DE8|nr:hypothetical protein [Nocardioides sp.]
MEVRYAPGAGVLLAAAQRWLLVDAPLTPEHVARLWGLLSGTGPVLEPLTDLLVELLGADVAFAILDTSPEHPGSVSRGTARLSVVDDAPRATPGEPPAPAVPGVGLIDGIPPEILAGRAPDPAPAPEVVTAPPPEEHTVRRSPEPVPERRPEPDPDHDGHTTFVTPPMPPATPPLGPPQRASAGAPTPPPLAPPTAPPTDPAGLHLQQHTHETVLAVRCPVGHVTAAFTPNCRVCGAPVPPQEPQRLPRPQLGLVRLPDGDTVPLDRGVVFGRQPVAAPESTDWPHLVRLPQGSSYVSRTHLRLELDGWLVLATDLGSRGGTTLRVPGRAPERIRAHETYVWEPGQVLDLADSYEIVLETTTDPGGNA